MKVSLHRLLQTSPVLFILPNIGKFPLTEVKNVYISFNTTVLAYDTLFVILHRFKANLLAKLILTIKNRCGTLNFCCC